MRVRETGETGCESREELSSRELVPSLLALACLACDLARDVELYLGVGETGTVIGTDANTVTGMMMVEVEVRGPVERRPGLTSECEMDTGA